jgi:ComF family protein
MLGDLLHLLFPECCRACGKALFKGEKVICTFCLFHIPRTNYHKYAGNPVEKKFWGKVPIEHASAFLLYNKGQRVQRLIHQLKYNGAVEIGTHLGNLFGNELKHSELFTGIDAVVPVPLHVSRLQKRGYNQSEFPAMEIAKCLNCVMDKKLIYRPVKTDTQTRKHSYERWENVESVFRLNESSKHNYHHVLLVDDVITTGSTLASCAAVLINEARLKVSIAALAVA